MVVDERPRHVIRLDKVLDVLEVLGLGLRVTSGPAGVRADDGR